MNFRLKFGLIALAGVAVIVVLLMLMQSPIQNVPTAETPTKQGVSSSGTPAASSALTLTAPAVATAVTPQLSPSATTATPGAQEAQQNVTVSISKDEHARVADIPTVYTVEYELYYWLELTPANFEKLRARGVEYKLEESATVLKFWDYQFDPHIGEPSLPTELTSVYTLGIPNLYIVQWVGPLKDEWLDMLKAQGVTTLGSRAGNAYLVRMTLEQATIVKTLDFVRWVGPYHAAYRSDPRIAWDVPGRTDRVGVVIYDDGQVKGTVEQTIQAIQALSGTVVEQGTTRRFDSTVEVVVSVPISALIPIKQMAAVILVDYSPGISFQDEMSNHIVANSPQVNLAADYRQWLANMGVTGNGVRVAVMIQVTTQVMMLPHILILQVGQSWSRMQRGRYQ